MFFARAGASSEKRTLRQVVLAFLVLYGTIGGHAQASFRFYRCIYVLNGLRGDEGLRSASVSEIWIRLKNDPIFFKWFSRQSAETLSSSTPQNILTRFETDRLNLTQAHKRARVRIFDLDSPSIREEIPCCASPQGRAVSIFLGISHSIRITRYEQMLIEMRSGDIVRFGNRQFVLGDFLGSGNATHIYAIQGRPNAVLRIPYLSLFDATEDLRHTYEGNGIQASRDYLAAYVRNIRGINGVSHVQIIEEDSLNRYAVISRVYGHSTARTLIASLVRRAFPIENDTLADAGIRTYLERIVEAEERPPVRALNRRAVILQLEALSPEVEREMQRIEPYFTDPRFTDRARNDNLAVMRDRLRSYVYYLNKLRGVATPEERDMLESLWALDQTLRPSDFNPWVPALLPLPDFYESTVTYSSEESLRQLVWDERRRNWILVDADDSDVTVFSRQNPR